MRGLPVTVRLLDPPLHEFLPHSGGGDRGSCQGIRHLGRGAAPARVGAEGIQPDARPSRLPSRHLLSGNLRDAGARHLRGGDRGRSARRPATPVTPEIMIPLVALKKELDILKAMHRPHRRGGREGERHGRPLSRRHDDRAAARRLARRGDRLGSAEFFSFGTNDLTQTTFGLSRDDAAIVPEDLSGPRHPGAGPLRQHRPGRRRRTDPDRSRARPQRRARTSSSASAASMAATRPRSISASRSGWIT
jgi:pyruvate,orthophosphate dikinase